ncbi:hypothetical protein [Anoxybacteroides tepidamans]|uniref:hypothetical protein n=1 Tax=Anoxybacteroides tepidamans TaxID=265948 RepID=UPI00047FC6F3|nr:hypothetical protein [Anoxybacillus tepidamans]
MSLRTKLFIAAISLSVLAACTNHKPEPETMYEAIPTASAQGVQTIHVKHDVRGKDVFIECIIGNFSFKKGTRRKVEGEGHIDVYLNGQKINEVFTAAFILRGLPTGKHKVHLELVHNDGSKYGVSYDFEADVS